MATRTRQRVSWVWAAMALGGCSADEPRTARDVLDTLGPDDADAAETSDAEVGDETDSEVHDDTRDTSPEVVEPLRCAAHEACNTLLDDAGHCPGRCLPVRAPLTCEGTVRLGVCHTHSPAEQTNDPIDFPGFRVTFDQVPERAIMGETHPLAFTVHNTSGAPLTLALRWRDPQIWRLEDATWDGVDAFTLEASGSRTFTANITALRQTVFSAGPDIIATFSFTDPADLRDDRPEWVAEPRADVLFGADQPIECGGYHFPATWCDEVCSGSGLYQSARCCDGVFYPSASCCNDADCGDGTCADGKCVERVPWLTSANGLPLGHITVRLVLVDTHTHFEDPCEDRFEDVKTQYDFAAVERWFDELAQRRFGRESMKIKWVVTGGVETSDFLTGESHWDNFSRELNGWLADRGCPMLDTYDKLIVSASSMEFWGYAGLYFDNGNIAVISPNSALLVAHELAHSFGARDLYHDLGGVLLHPADLMGNNLQEGAGDGVAWAEMGFGDMDHNGVIDLAEYAAYPERLEVADASATLMRRGTLEIRWRFAGREGDLRKHVVVPKYRFVWSLANFDVEWHDGARWKTMAFDPTQVDLAAVRAAGEVTVTLGARHRFTGLDWQLNELVLDQTLTIPVTEE